MDFGIKRSPPIKHRGSVAVCLCIVLAGAVLQYLARNSVRDIARANQIKLNESSSERPPLYLPESRYVRFVTLGFNNVVSDVLWFNTINYFGTQLRGKRDYRWLGQMCNLVTKLDKNKGHVYEFCSNMLAWEAKDFQGAIKLLDRAVLSHPNVWRYRYLRGFNYWYFLSRNDLALSDLQTASKLPNAPTFLASLASRLMVDQHTPEAALAFLGDLIKNSNDDMAKKVLEEKYKRGLISRDLKNLARAVETYEKQFGKKPVLLSELVSAGLIKAIPAEPFGGEYILDGLTGKITNSSGEKGLEFFGKTKDTGIFGMENNS